MSVQDHSRGMQRPQSIAEVARLTREKPHHFSDALAEFLDEFYAHSDRRQAMIAEEPPLLGETRDAWLGAVAEHLARVWELAIPRWTDQACRFLDKPVFAGGLDSVKAALLVESPLAFRRRMIFVEAVPLRRARTPQEGRVPSQTR
jgi:hypothetical protein